MVVAFRELACEPVPRHPDLFSFPCRFAVPLADLEDWRAGPIGVARTAMTSSDQTSAHAIPVP